MAPAVDSMYPADWSAVRAIYAEGIATGDATFELEPPGTWEQFDSKYLPAPRLVARDGDRVAGWAALSSVSQRAVYRGVAEVSIYVRATERGKGLGRSLLSRLTELSESEGIWTLQAGIFPENESSIRLHEACGFRIVGTRVRIGQLHGRWRDTLLLERRSGVAGL